MIQYTNHVVAWAALSCAALVCLWRGEWPDRLGYLLIAANWIVTPLVEDRRSWLDLQLGVMAVNATLVIGLGILAGLSSRVWPLAAAGLECAGVLVRAAPAINSHALMRAAPYADNVIGYLVLGCAVGGVVIEAGKNRSCDGLRSR